MHIFYPGQHELHHPQFELFNGERTEHQEVPQRLYQILAALSKTQHTLHEVLTLDHQSEVGSALAKIHDSHYLSWLASISPQEALYPSVFHSLSTPLLSGHPSVQWGNFVTDTFTPLLPNTWQASLHAAQTVYRATQELLSGATQSYALVRPPGHHAGRSRVGGYCYLNNAGLAAELMSSHGKVAILDVDYHHGNGTQDIFYERGDVITCSLHADPQRKFPYFAGFANEEGTGNGLGANKNFPLPAHMTNEQYQPVLEQALAWIHDQKPEYLVVSLGLDTHESDPIADFKLTTPYYATMARTIAQLGVPTIIVQEGGYSTAAIGANVVSFLDGLL